MEPHKVDLGEGEHLRFGEVEVTIKASGEVTDDAFSIIEEADPVDTPLHVHEREDEIFIAIEGEHVIRVGDEEFTIGPGEMAFGPRGVPHSQRRVVPRKGRLLIMLSPPGFEGFFRELAAADREGTLGPDAYSAASERYGITWIDEDR